MFSNFTFTPDLLIALLGVAVSLFFSYVPKVNVWFAAKPKEEQQLWMLILMFVITVVIFVGACFEVFFPNNFACDRATALGFIGVYIQALISNQGVYLASPKTKAVKAARAARDALI